jgi:hypothetical protein
MAVTSYPSGKEMRLESKWLEVQIPPGTTFLRSCWGTRAWLEIFVCILVVFLGRFCFSEGSWGFRPAFPPSQLCTFLHPARYPPTTPPADLLPFHSCLFFFLWGSVILVLLSVCLRLRSWKREEEFGMRQPATSWSFERLLFCSALLW